MGFAQMNKELEVMKAEARQDIEQMKQVKHVLDPKMKWDLTHEVSADITESNGTSSSCHCRKPQISLVILQGRMSCVLGYWTYMM